MKKAQLADALSLYADQKRGNMKGQETLARFLAYYFSALDIPADQKYGFWRIEGHIPQLLLGAFEEFRCSEDPIVMELREAYEKELGRPFPNLTDIGLGNGMDQGLAIQGIGALMNEVTGLSHLDAQIDNLFNAERHLVYRAFYRFLDQVLCKGLYEVISNSPARGMSGEFGETTLRSFITAGRLIFTFDRPVDHAEQSISFVCNDDDPLGLGSGQQSCYVDLSTALAMIDDVVTGWPAGRDAQAAIYTADKKVMIG